MDIKTKEFDPMQLQVTVTPELGVGYGRIGAVNRMEDTEAHEFANEVRSYVEETTLEHGCGCIDGRCVLHTLDGNESEPGPKTAGGIAVTTLLSMEMNDAFGDQGDVYDHLARVVDMLEEGDIPVRFHIDADHEDGIKEALVRFRTELADVDNLDDFLAKVTSTELSERDRDLGTGCGMSDQLVGAASNLARLPRTFKKDGKEYTETAEDIEKRLEFIHATSAAIEGSKFSESVFNAHVENMTERIKIGYLDSWNSLKALVVVDRMLASRGVEDGVMSRLEVLQTSEQGVHGHTEDLIGVNKRQETTVNQNRLVKETGREAFWYDQWIAQPIADAASGSLTNTKALTQGVAQAVTETNIAGAFQLTDGTQRAAIYS